MSIVALWATCIFSSPEPLGSQAELIVYPCSGVHLSVVVHQSQISCGASMGRVNESLYKWSHDQDGRLKIYIHDKNLTSGGCLPLAWVCVHVYDLYIRTSRNLLGQSKPNEASLGKWKKILKLSRSHDQDGRHSQIW